MDMKNYEQIKTNGGILQRIPLQSKKMDTKGVCPHCRGDVYQAEIILDDTYNCIFRCPHCPAYLFLTNKNPEMRRGYSHGVMEFDLPDENEKKENNLPDNIPLAAPPQKGQDNEQD